MDEAFGLKSKPKAGNPSKQNARKNVLFFRLCTMAQLRAADPKLSIEKAAAKVCNNADSSEVETLAREWKRQNKQKNNFFNELVVEFRGK